MLNDFIRSDPFLFPGKQIIVFVATRHHVEYLQAIFSAMFATPQSVAIYVRSQANRSSRLFLIVFLLVQGKMDQAARKIALAKFSKKKADVMFVTDLAARGIDIPVLDVVINYDFPPKPKVGVRGYRCSSLWILIPFFQALRPSRWSCSSCRSQRRGLFAG